MEGGGINSCVVTEKGVETAEIYRVVSRNENPAQLSESPMSAAPVMAETSPPVGIPAAPPVGMAVQPFGMTAPPVSMEGKKKRGRPKKYAPDGSVLALSPMPISASIPFTGDFSAWKQGRGRPVDSFKKKYNLEFENPDEGVAYAVGANFTPHIITVNTGEDVTMKVISFSQQGSRAICILSANGAISNVTLRQPNSSGGTLTYEGRFEILSLTGSFMPTDNGGTKSRSGGMSVSLAGPDGRVLGGGISGLLIAAGPIQVVVGSFLPGHQQEAQKPKPTVIFSPTIVNHNSRHFTERGYDVTPTPIRVPNNLSRENELSVLKSSENELSFSGSESKDPSGQKCGVSC